MGVAGPAGFRWISRGGARSGGPRWAVGARGPGRPRHAVRRLSADLVGPAGFGASRGRAPSGRLARRSGLAGPAGVARSGGFRRISQGRAPPWRVRRLPARVAVPCRDPLVGAYCKASCRRCPGGMPCPARGGPVPLSRDRRPPSSVSTPRGALAAGAWRATVPSRRACPDRRCRHRPQGPAAPGAPCPCPRPPPPPSHPGATPTPAPHPPTCVAPAGTRPAPRAAACPAPAPRSAGSPPAPAPRGAAPRQ